MHYYIFYKLHIFFTATFYFQITIIRVVFERCYLREIKVLRLSIPSCSFVSYCNEDSESWSLAFKTTSEVEMHEKLYILRHMLLPPDRDSTSDGQENFHFRASELLLLPLTSKLPHQQPFFCH